jgi:hypothetical protein
MMTTYAGASSTNTATVGDLQSKYGTFQQQHALSKPHHWFPSKRTIHDDVFCTDFRLLR